MPATRTFVRIGCAALLVAGCGAKLRSVSPQIAVAPASIAFGASAVGVTQELRVQVSNSGSADLHVAAIKVATDPLGELSLASVLTEGCDGSGRATPLVVGPGGCAQFAVRWSPAAVHDAAGSIEIDSDDSAQPVVTLPVSGSGKAPVLQICAMTIDGAVLPALCTTHAGTLANVPALDFGAGTLGQTLGRKLRISNQGQADLLLSPAPRLGPGSASAFQLATPTLLRLAPGQSEDLLVSATPASNGAQHGTLQLLSNDPVAAEVDVQLQVTVSGWQLCASPAQLAFGSLAVGQTEKQTLHLTNCGNVDFSLAQFALTPTSPTSQEFSAALPSASAPLKAGASTAIDVTYAPTAARSDAAAITANVVLSAGAPVPQSWALSGTGLLPACSTNPAARIQAFRNLSSTPFDPAAVSLTPLDKITLNASTSTAGTSPVFSWSLTAEPPGAVDALSAASGSEVSITVRQVGDYAVKLALKDAQGCAATTQVTLHVVPQGALHVELTWAEGYGDVDLHYVGPGGTYYEETVDSPSPAGDLYWVVSQATAHGAGAPTSNAGSPWHLSTPDWGAGNSIRPDGDAADDAHFDIDQVDGYGPENVTHAKPFDGTYQIFIHYYCASADDNHSLPPQGDATATVRVWVQGVEVAAPPTQLLHEFQLWHAGDVVVSGGGSHIQVNWSGEVAKETTLGSNCSE